jgi:hypothetical protein
MLGPQELARLEVADSGMDESNDLSTSCVWRSADRAIAITLDVTVDSPMERVYRALEVVGPPQNFELRGHRAAREGAPNSSICTVYVELAENQVASAEVSMRSVPGTACGKSEQALSFVIDSLSSRS